MPVKGGRKLKIGILPFVIDATPCVTIIITIVYISFFQLRAFNSPRQLSVRKLLLTLPSKGSGKALLIDEEAGTGAG